MILIVFAFAGLLGYLAFSHDKFSKPSWQLLSTALLLGVMGGFLIGPAEDYWLQNVTVDEFRKQAMTAAVMEEATKLLCIGGMLLWFRREIKDPMDGVVCGSFFGIGFALLELRSYLGAEMFSLQIPVDLLGAEMVRLMIHGLTGGIMGFAVGMMPYWEWKRIPLLLIWPGSALAIHFLWNFFIGLPSQRPDSWLIQKSMAVSLMVLAMGMYGMSVSIGEKRSRELHQLDSGERLWGWPFTMMMDIS